MISATLSTSAKIYHLHQECPKLAEFCRNLFTLLVIHADDHGRLAGDELTVKMKIDPISPRKLPEFVAALHVLSAVGLIVWYQVDGVKIVEIVDFHKHQDLKGHQNRHPRFPPCTSIDQRITRRRGDMGEVGGISPPLGKSGETREEKRTELKGTEDLASAREADSPRLDECFAEFQGNYPESRRSGGYFAQTGFVDAVGKIDGGYVALAARLEQHKRSEQWTVAKRIPNMRKWFEDELWRQELAPPESRPANAGAKARPSGQFLSDVENLPANFVTHGKAAAS